MNICRPFLNSAHDRLRLFNGAPPRLKPPLHLTDSWTMAPPVAKAPVVLVIDDDEKMRELVANILDAFGFRVIPAATSEEGMTIALMQVPDLVLCDVILPDALGFDTVKALNAHPATSRVPCVLMTGYPYMKQYGAQEVASGAKQDFKLLLKPFSMNEIVDTVTQALRAANLEVESPVQEF
jgi:CheY-like chemotaxis protein